MSVEYTVRQGRREDMAGLLKLALDEGWNNVIEHLYFVFDCFPNGVFVAEDADGEIISHCASMPMDDSNGFMSYYVTKKSWRGYGIGRQVFELSYKTLRTRNISLSAMWEKKEMYASGYFKVATFTLIAYEFPIKNLNLLTDKEQQGSSIKIADAKDVDLAKILDYDRKIHLIPREKVVKWVLDFAHTARVAIDGDEIKGWGTIFEGQRGYCLMPLYGDTPKVAKALVNDLLKQVIGKPEAEIEICFPEDNTAAKKLYEDIGAFNGEYSCFKIMRMCTEQEIPIPTQEVYSVLCHVPALA